MKEAFRLSDETYEVLKGNEKRIAEEYICDASYIYAIKNQYSNDPFPHFKKLYAAAAKSKSPVCHWRNALDAIDARYAPCAPQRDVSECLIEKIQSDSEATTKLARALLDGELDEREIREIEAAFEKSEINRELIREHFRFRRGVLELEKESKAKLRAV
jgi:hypothetical protein